MTNPAAHRERPDPITLYRAYTQDHPGRGVPVDAVTDSGFALGRWVQRMRAARICGTLPGERIAELDAAGFTWSGADDRARGRAFRSDQRFTQMVAALARYRATYGDVVIKQSYIDPDGHNLGAWVARQQRAWRRGELRRDRATKLAAIGLRPTQHATLQAGLAMVPPAKGN